MSRSYTSCPPQATTWRVVGQLYFYFYIFKMRIVGGSRPLPPDTFHCQSVACAPREASANNAAR
jgi:hypothetical protein